MAVAYYFSKVLDAPFDEAIERTRQALAAQGFGVLTDVDVKQTLEKKLGVAFRPYRIIGVCSPQHAYTALMVEDKIGLMLPCGMIVQHLEDGRVEVAAIDPAVGMAGVENPKLAEVMAQVRAKLQAVIDAL